MRALCIRHPYAELRKAGDEDGGELDLSWRSRATGIVGERFYLLRQQRRRRLLQGVVARSGDAERRRWVCDPAAVDDPTANGLRLFPEELPTGVIVGSAVIEKVVEVASGQLSVGSLRIRLYR